MIRKFVVAAVAASLLGTATLSVATDNLSQQAAPVPTQAVSLNPMNPAVVSGFMNPQSHQMYHQALMNPAGWAQFTQPNFYMQMANPAMMMQWMNPASYQVMMDPNTYMYWMQPNAMMGEMTAFMNPASYQAMMNPASYHAFMNPGTYMTWMNPAAYTAAAQQMAAAPAAGYNWFDMNAWTNYFQPPVNQPKAEAQGE